MAKALALGNKFSVPSNVKKIPINGLIANIEISINNIERENLKFNIRETKVT